MNKGINGPRLSPPQRLQNAASAMFLIYIVKTLFAYSIAASLTELLESSFPGLYDSFSFAYEHPQLPYFIESIWRGRPVVNEYYAAYLGIFVFYFLVTPFLSMLWVCALSNPVTLRYAAFEASRLYYRSAALLYLYVTSLLSIAVLTGTASYFVRLVPYFSDNDLAQDTVSITVLVPGLLFALFLYLLHDAANVLLATSDLRPFEAIRRGFQCINRRGRVLAFLGWHTCAILLTLLGLIVVLCAQANLGHFDTAILVLSQILVLGRIAVRGRWLASLFES